MQQLDAVLRLKDRFSDTLKAAEKQTKNFGSAWEVEGRKIENVGKKLHSASYKFWALSASAAGVLTGATKAASDYEEALRKVSTIADTTEVPLSKLKKQIIEVSNETGIAAKDVADDVYNAISAGQKTGDAVAFVGKAAKLAKAGFTDSASALDILTTTLNAYNLSADKTGEVSDILLQIQNKGKTTVGELAKNMGRVIPTANSLGVNLKQLGAAYAILTANGIATAEATTYTNSMLNELGKTGTKADKALRDASGGKSFQDLIKNGKSIGDILAILSKNAEKSGQSLADMFGSAEAGKAALTLLKDGAEGFNQSVEHMNNSTGLTEEGYKKMQSNIEKLRKGINKVKNALIEVGGEAGPYIGKFGDLISEIGQRFSDLSPETKKFIFYALAITAALGPVISKVTRLTFFLADNWKHIMKLKKGIGRLIGAFAGLGIGPVLAIAAISAALYILITHFDEVKAVGKAFIDYFVSGFTDFAKMIKDMLKGLVDFVAGVFTGDWRRAWEGIKAICKAPLDYIDRRIRALLDLFKRIKDAILGINDDVNNSSLEPAKAPYKPVKKKVDTSVFTLATGNIPHHAKGTNNFKGGLTYINEHYKGEIVNLPSGSQIIPHDKSIKSAYNEGKNEQNGNSFTISFDGAVFHVREEADVKKIANEVVKKLVEYKQNRKPKGVAV